MSDGTSSRRQAVAEQAPLAAVWAAGAVLTAVGIYSVARACHIPAGLAWLYPPIFDGLALVAYRTVAKTTGAGQIYAGFVVLVCTGLSAAAQAAHLAAGAGLTAAATTTLRGGVGAAPAVAVALAAHLHWLTTHPKTAAASDVGASAGAAAPDEPSPVEGLDNRPEEPVGTPPAGQDSGRGLAQPAPGAAAAPARPEVGQGLSTAASGFTGGPARPDAAPTQGRRSASERPPGNDVAQGHEPLVQVGHGEGHNPVAPRATVDQPEVHDLGQGVMDQGHGPGPQGHVDQGHEVGHGLGHDMDLTQLSDVDQVRAIVDHNLLTLTQAEMAHRLGVSLTTAKRRIREAKRMAAAQNLRVVR